MIANAVVALSPAAKEDRFELAFPDLQGDLVTHDDPRFAGKVVVIDVFGTWCPNCNDQAPVLAGWDRKYRSRGLAIVGLAFEMTGDVERIVSFPTTIFVGHGRAPHGARGADGAGARGVAGRGWAGVRG